MTENVSTVSTQRPPLVITLWERYGCNMEAIAKQLATELNLPLYQQAYSSEALEEAETKREKQGRFGALTRHFLDSFVAPDGVVTPADAAHAGNYAKMAEKNEAVVVQRAATGGVLQGRDGQYLLHDRPNTVHIKLDGPVEQRIACAAKVHNISEERAARRQRLEDEFRSEIADKQYSYDPRDNGWYDLVINSSALTTDEAVHLIKEAVKVFAK